MQKTVLIPEELHREYRELLQEEGIRDFIRDHDLRLNAGLLALVRLGLKSAIPTIRIMARAHKHKETTRNEND
jgi:hypothetical protein